MLLRTTRRLSSLSRTAALEGKLARREASAAIQGKEDAPKLSRADAIEGRLARREAAALLQSAAEASSLTRAEMIEGRLARREAAALVQSLEASPRPNLSRKHTQTPGSTTCLEKSWLKPHATIICSGSDQPTKQEIPTDVLKASKYVSDLTKQTSKVGELRSAIADGSMTEADVYAEIGEVCNGSKPGREGKELIVVDLTGTGAQDAAIGQVAWDKLGN